MKQGKSYFYSFKCLNCKDEHQADSNDCLFWKHRFNKDKHVKKNQKNCERKNMFICLAVDSAQLYLLTESKSFCRMLERTILSLGSYWKPAKSWISFLFNNSHSLLFTLSQVHLILIAIS